MANTVDGEDRKPGPTNKVREKVFGKSYNEVLLFLKHEDDKINRVLTALAFLTTAGVTLYIFSRSDEKAYADFPTFGNTGVHIDDYFFASFIIGVALSVALALVSLDPTSFLPFFLRHPHDEPADEHSLLYYAAIARHPNWSDVYGEEALYEHYLRSLHADTHRLARRAVHKVRRFGTASAAVQFTVVALALLGASRLNHVSLHGRWVLITAILITYAVMPIIDFAYFWGLHFPDVRREEVHGSVPPGDKQTTERLRDAFLFYMPFIAVAVLGLVLKHRDWEPVTFALFGTLLLRLLARFEWDRVTPWLQRSVMATLAIVGIIWFWCG